MRDCVEAVLCTEGVRSIAVDGGIASPQSAAGRKLVLE
jgi:hypothetical protein